ELAFLRGKPGLGETSIGEDGAAALGATDAQHFIGLAGAIDEAAVIELRETLPLSAMDRQKALVDLRAALPRILLFNHLHHRPHSRFPGIAGGHPLSAQ